jgi:hypothetical protein
MKPFAKAQRRKGQSQIGMQEDSMAKYVPLAGLLLLTAIAIGVAGCDSPSGATGGTSMNEVATTATAQQEAERQKVEADRKAKESADAAAKAAADAQPRKAGRPKVKEGGGYFTAIVGARRKILNETDRWAWIQAVQHFQAREGRLPKDHAEFMKEIESLEINLGYKEPDEEFLYVPEEGDFGELYVVKIAEEPVAK